jgi:hypothetical protein
MMSQPPPDQDRPPEQDRPPDQDQLPPSPAGRKSSIWPSGDEPPAWPPIGPQTSGPSGRPVPSWPQGNQGSSWPAGNQGSSGALGEGPAPWPSGPAQEPSASWSPGEPSQAPPPPPAWPPSGQPPLSSPGYGYGRRLPRFRRRFPIRAVIVLALFIAFGFAVRGLTSHHKPVAVTPSPPASITLHTGLKAPPGVVGASFSLDDGTGNDYQVTLVKVIDPARGADQVTTPDSGKRFVGLVFRIKGLTGSPQGEDADRDAVLVGANGQDYPAGLNRIAGYANFDDGVIHVTPGDTVTGAVAFQVPNGVAVSLVQWTALSGFGSMVEWNVPG